MLLVLYGLNALSKIHYSSWKSWQNLEKNCPKFLIFAKFSSGTLDTAKITLSIAIKRPPTCKTNPAIAYCKVSTCVVPLHASGWCIAEKMQSTCLFFYSLASIEQKKQSEYCMKEIQTHDTHFCAWYQY